MAVNGPALSRRRVLLTGAGLCAAPLLAAPHIARAADAQFTYKFATGQDPTHPVNVHLAKAFDSIREKTSGAFDIKLFPANQLGTETVVLSQVREGAIEFLILSASILATLVPVSGIANTAYAFADYDAVWKAMDGNLGQYVRAQTEKTGLIATWKIWDNGFRQVTSSDRDIRGPADFAGFKIRVPPAPMLVSFFSAIGASPTPLNFAEVYSALQTKLIEGQENALSLIFSTRLYEVQKHVAMTGHSWDGYWPLANRRAWARLPEAFQQIMVAEMNAAVIGQRADVAEKDRTLRATLEQKGLIFRDVDKSQFREVLTHTDYYKSWKAKYGDEAWGELESACGKLA
jgi:tripartite ATP-independent transporter DctP family solute receptor